MMRLPAAVLALMLFIGAARGESAFRDEAADLVMSHNALMLSLGEDGARIDAGAALDAGDGRAAFLSVDRRTVFSFVPDASGEHVAEAWIMTGDPEAFADSVLMSAAGLWSGRVSPEEEEKASPVLAGMVTDCLLAGAAGEEYGRRTDLGPVAVQIFFVRAEGTAYMMELLLAPGDAAE